jgi:hypothetical protein
MDFTGLLAGVAAKRMSADVPSSARWAADGL